MEIPSPVVNLERVEGGKVINLIQESNEKQRKVIPVVSQNVVLSQVKNKSTEQTVIVEKQKSPSDKYFSDSDEVLI